MARTLVQFDAPVIDASGERYTAKACGREREDRLWEAWIEFENERDGNVVRSVRETTQPNLTDLNYWATGLTPVYLDGALARTLNTPAPKTPVVVVPPRYDRPAQRRAPRSSGHESILNPFSVYEKSPDLLAQELTALRGWHLKQIIKDYGLADEQDTPLDAMNEAELGSLILRRVRDLHPRTPVDGARKRQQPGA